MSVRARQIETETASAGETRASLDGLVGYRLRRLQGLFVAHWGRWFRDLDLGVTPVQGGILLLIGENAGLTQVALARLLKVEAPTLMQALNPLFELGLVARTRAAHDGRAFALKLTRRGEAAARVVAAESRRHEADLLTGLTAKERDTLLGLLEKALASGEAAMERPSQD